jgi:hypothetical protein
MHKTSIRTFALVAVAAAVLSACGGDDDPFESNDPTVTNQRAEVTVAGSVPALNGLYSTTTVSLNNVVKVNPVGGDPETCRTRFAGLLQFNGGNRLMDGDIRYIPGSNELRTTVISIAGAEYRMLGSAQASVDRANNEIDFNGASFTSTQGTGATLTLVGSIPMRTGRPEGC